MEQYQKFTDEELIEKLRLGEDVCMDVLIERYKRQVRNQARPLYLIGGESEDLIQEGMLGLFKAIRDYHPEHGAAFGAFARLCISRQLYSAIQTSNRQKNIPLNSYVELSGEIGEQTEELKEKSPEELLIDQENKNRLYTEIFRRLSPFEREVLQDYLAGKPYAEIAKSHRKPRKSIDNAMQRIRRKLGRIRRI